jgi:signal transduction histidine kinase/PAS domain-containing protein
VIRHGAPDAAWPLDPTNPMETAPHRPEPGPQRQQPFEVLCQILADIRRAARVEGCYEGVLDRLCRAVSADHGALLVVEEGVMRLARAEALSHACRAGLEGFAPWSADVPDPTPLIVADVAADTGLAPVRAALQQEGVVAVAYVPLVHETRLVGELVLLRDRPETLTDAEVALARAVAAELAFGIGRSRMERDRAELLRQSDAEVAVLDAVVKQMPAGVLLADAPSGRIVLANARAEAIWGRTLYDVREVTDYTRLGGMDEEGRPLRAEEWPLARAVLGGEVVQGEVVALEVGGEGGEGDRLLLRVSAAPVVDGRGRQVAAVAAVENVTREREEESRQAFLEHATRFLSESLDPRTAASALAEAVLGPYADWCVVYQLRDRERAERVVTAHTDPALTGLVRPAAAGSVALDGDHPVARVVRERRPLAFGVEEGAPFPLSESEGEALLPGLAAQAVLILPLLARERAVGALVLVRASGGYGRSDMDLLAELGRRAGLALDNALLYEHARTADQAKANFLAVMSHEFRTPLSAILGYADILTAEVHGELNPRQRQHLDRVKASVRHLSHLVDEILSYASMEAGRDRVRTEAVEAVALARDVAGIMEPIAEAAGLDLRVRPGSEQLDLVTDPSKLRQILINLLSNAIKYTLHGSVELALSATSSRVRFDVIDTGPGIEAAYQEEVFEPFWQVEREGRPRINGTGLGLTVARRLARLMGGDVTLESEVGVGSRFTVELPRPVARSGEA